MSRRTTVVTGVFCAVSLLLVWLMTGMGAPSTGDGLAQAGSPVNLPMIALVGALLVGGVVFLIVGARRNRR